MASKVFYSDDTRLGRDLVSREGIRKCPEPAKVMCKCGNGKDGRTSTKFRTQRYGKTVRLFPSYVSYDWAREQLKALEEERVQKENK